jgi:hypothetical protein
MGVHRRRPIADQRAAALGTPITVDIDENGVKKHRTVGRGGHLSSAEAAEMLRACTPATATATVRDAAHVDVPQATLPASDASLWDLGLTAPTPNELAHWNIESAAETRVRDGLGHL